MFLRNIINKGISRHISEIIPIILLCLLAIIIQPPVTDLMINADTFVQLLSAKLLSETGSFSGYLGVGGDLLSPLFYRGGFSLMIYLINFFTEDLWLSAKILLYLFYYLAIVATYFVTRKLYSPPIAVASTLLLMLGFSFSSWATVVMAEVPTIGLVALSLALLVYSRKNHALLYLSALIFGLALTFRLEMMLLLPGWLILLCKIHEQYRLAIYYALLSLFVWLLYFAWLYFTHVTPNEWFWQEAIILKQTLFTHHLFLYIAPLALILIPLAIRWRWLLLLPAAGAVGYLFYRPDHLYENLAPLQLFIANDLFLVLVALAGLIVLFWKQKHLFYALSISVGLLVMLYYSRGEYRYYVHLALPLGLAAGAFVAWIYQRQKILGSLLVAVILIGQAALFAQPRFLPPVSYEQIVIEHTQAMIARHNINPANLTICSVFSEAFNYSTGIAAIDCFEGEKDIYRSSFPKLVVVDEDISRHQPEFIELLESKYSENLIDQEWIVTEYIEKNDTSITRYPLRWYWLDGAN